MPARLRKTTSSWRSMVDMTGLPAPNGHTRLFHGITIFMLLPVATKLAQLQKIGGYALSPL